MTIQAYPAAKSNFLVKKPQFGINETKAKAFFEKLTQLKLDEYCYAIDQQFHIRLDNNTVIKWFPWDGAASRSYTTLKLNKEGQPPGHWTPPESSKDIPIKEAPNQKLKEYLTDIKAHAEFADLPQELQDLINEALS